MSHDDVLIPEVVEEETALTRQIIQREQSFMERAEKMKDALVVFETRAQLLAKAHTIGIGRTRPEDWILTKDREGNAIAMLAGAGADLVADVFGIQIRNIRPVDARGIFDPEKIPVEGLPGVYTYRAWCDARSAMTGREIESLEASRRSDEQFTGRSVDKSNKIVFRGDGALESDLRAAVQTLLRTKAVRVLCGMSKLPASELTKAGLDISKCRKGSGYGSSDARVATSTAEAGAPDAAEAVWKEILRRVAGDDDMAHEVLRDITKYDAYKTKDGKDIKAFGGAKSCQELNTEVRVSRAKEKLAKHPVFGDDALRRKDGDDE
jgi:hypothetical protein